MSILEDVPIETIHVGDYVSLGPADKPVCVLGLTTTRHRTTNRVIGWVVELDGGARVWLRRRARVLRRRSAADDRASAALHQKGSADRR